MTKQASRTTTKSASGERLRDTLAAMICRQVVSPSSAALTATTLCDLAGISRNALYRYHPEVVRALHAAQQKHRPRSARASREEHLRRDNAALREQAAKLAALVDHYFAAWQETRLALQRRERELAELRRDAKMRVVPIATGRGCG